MVGVEYNICFVVKIKLDHAQWYVFFMAQQALYLCVSFCLRLVRNITSRRKNARIKGCFALYQSVALFSEMFAFEVAKR